MGLLTRSILVAFIFSLLASYQSGLAHPPHLEDNIKSLRYHIEYHYDRINGLLNQVPIEGGLIQAEAMALVEHAAAMQQAASQWADRYEILIDVQKRILDLTYRLGDLASEKQVIRGVEGLGRATQTLAGFLGV